MDSILQSRFHEFTLYSRDIRARSAFLVRLLVRYSADLHNTQNSPKKREKILLADTILTALMVKQSLSKIAFGGDTQSWQFWKFSCGITSKACNWLKEVTMNETRKRRLFFDTFDSFYFFFFFVVWAICCEVYAGWCTVYIDHSQLALTLGLQVFSYTGAITTGRLLGRTTCLPHKNRSIPISALPKDTTSKLAGLFFTLSLFCWAPNREAVNTNFLSLLVWLDLGNEPHVYRLRSRRFNHYAIAPVAFITSVLWKKFPQGEKIFSTLLRRIIYFTLDI